MLRLAVKCMGRRQPALPILGAYTSFKCSSLQRIPGHLSQPPGSFYTGSFATSTYQPNKSSQKNRHGFMRGALRWFAVLAGGGIGSLAVYQLLRTSKDGQTTTYEQNKTWQLVLFRLLPSRMLSRVWGMVTAKELPSWSRPTLLGLYIWLFDGNMSEAQVEDLRQYSSLMKLFTRQLKHGAREITRECPLVCPVDGKVLHFGRVVDGKLEQVKGVTYNLDKFLGPDQLSQCNGWPLVSDKDEQNVGRDNSNKELYHVIFYLAPGDYHHFHSPTDWSVRKRRHFPGELLTVAPWAARTMPGLFVLNERAVLSGCWEHGFFSMAAVGAFNVGSINLAVDKDLTTNIKGRYTIGEFRDKELGVAGSLVHKGDRIGGFNLGSSVVLIFEAPKDFHFNIKVGQKVFYGQPLGSIPTDKTVVE